MKILDRGYWISKMFYYQSWPYFFLNALRFRSLTFFSACNPGIIMGGMLDEKKTEIYKLLPPKSVPYTLVIRKENDIPSILKSNGITFPVVVKPNIGFKGHMVAKIDSPKDLTAYLNKMGDREFLLQEYIAYEHEYSLLYYRMPKTGGSGISSLIEKKFPSVTGNGKSTLRELINNVRNPFVKKDWVFEKLKSRLDTVPENREVIIIDDVGNYSRGAKFFNLSDLIDKELVRSADDYFKYIPGIDFCRLDFKSPSLESFKEGQFKVLELNGAKSEPLHIYDPELSFISVAKSIHRHWRILGRIVRERMAMSFELPSLKKGYKSYISVKKLMKS